jgi:hypothetical protein
VVKIIPPLFNFLDIRRQKVMSIRLANKQGNRQNYSGARTKRPPMILGAKNKNKSSGLFKRNGGFQGISKSSLQPACWHPSITARLAKSRQPGTAILKKFCLWTLNWGQGGLTWTTKITIESAILKIYGIIGLT